jgi:hypothetical protein
LKHHEKGDHDYLKGKHHGHKHNDKHVVSALPLDPAEAVSGKGTGNDGTDNVAGYDKEGVPQIPEKGEGENGPQIIAPLKIFGKPHYRHRKKFRTCFQGTDYKPIKGNSVNQHQNYQYGVQHKYLRVVPYTLSE